MDETTMFTRREKTQLIGGAIFAAALLSWLAAGLHVPAFPGYSMSLVQQPSAAVAILVTAIGFVLCTFLSALISGRVRHDAGLWCAAMALIALSARGGPVRFVLMSASGPSVFWRLAAEILLFGAILALGALVQDILVRYRLLRTDSEMNRLEAPSSAQQGILATIIGAVIAIVIMLILCQSDRKLQVVIAVWVASFVGALAGYHLFPTKPVGWFVAIPLLCGLVGYVANYFTDPSGWVIGEPRGFLAALARPLPVDYAGAGSAGAITGYWLSGWWRLKRQSEANEPDHNSNPAS
jgi:hypothetical protein